MRLSNPMVLASGVVGASIEKVIESIKSGAGAAVTKSVGLNERKGYEKPNLIELEYGFINAIGLSNPGAEAFSKMLKPANGLPIFVSIFGSTVSEYERIISFMDDLEFIGYELNLSCPHVKGYGIEVGHDPALVRSITRSVKSVTNKKVFVKLSPNTERIIDIANAAADSGADGLTAINTVRAMAIDIEKARPALSNTYGGLSGKAIKPIALRCVYELREEFDLPIMGCGGIYDWKDALEFIFAGANAVQIGSAASRDFTVFKKIADGLIMYMSENELKELSSLIGVAHKR